MTIHKWVLGFMT